MSSLDDISPPSSASGAAPHRTSCANCEAHKPMRLIAAAPSTSPLPQALRNQETKRQGKKKITMKACPPVLPAVCQRVYDGNENETSAQRDSVWTQEEFQPKSIGLSASGDGVIHPRRWPPRSDASCGRGAADTRGPIVSGCLQSQTAGPLIYNHRSVPPIPFSPCAVEHAQAFQERSVTRGLPAVGGLSAVCCTSVSPTRTSRVSHEATYIGCSCCFGVLGRKVNAAGSWNTCGRCCTRVRAAGAPCLMAAPGIV